MSIREYIAGLYDRFSGGSVSGLADAMSPRFSHGYLVEESDHWLQ
nr:hypothetical protein [Paenalcaligenes hominis]